MTRRVPGAAFLAAREAFENFGAQQLFKLCKVVRQLFHQINNFGTGKQIKKTHPKNHSLRAQAIRQNDPPFFFFDNFVCSHTEQTVHHHEKGSFFSPLNAIPSETHKQGLLK